MLNNKTSRAPRINSKKKVLYKNGKIKNSNTYNKWKTTDLVHTLSYVEDNGLTLVVSLAKPLTCVTVAYSSLKREY